MDCWLETQFGSIQSEKKLQWDGARHYSDTWTNFEQVAYHITGKLMVMCRCDFRGRKVGTKLYQLHARILLGSGYLQ